jgi:S1-C subfamily serine protease
MEIRCRCTGCSAKFKVDGKYAGKKARCPKCQAVVEVPLANGDDTVNVTPTMGTAPSTTAIGTLAAGAPTIANPVASPKPGTTTVAIPVAKSPALQVAPPASESPLPSVGNRSRQVGDAVSTIPSFTPPSADATSSPREFPVFSTAAASSITPAKSAASQPRGRKKSSPLPILIGGALTVVIAAVVAVLVMNSGGGSGKQPGAKNGGAGTVSAKVATLNVDWPQDQRSGGSLVIDGQREAIASAGSLKFTLRPGEHRVVMLRRGFEPFEATVTLAPGQDEHLVPQWTTASVAVVPPPGVGTPAPAPNPAAVAPTPSGNSGDFPIGTAVQTASIRGFEGWHQMLELAKREAAQSKKDLLILFGCSDAQRATQELGREFEQAGVKQSHVCVMIDFPRTAAGLDVLADRGQNEMLLGEFGIKSLPTLALADEQGRTYFLKREWEGGFGGLGAQLVEWSKLKAERDALLAAAAQGAEPEQLVAATKAVKWIQDRSVTRFYAQELEEWMMKAERHDPENKQAVLEVFFEPRWLIDIVQVNEEDAAAVARVAAQLDPWVTRKFQDPDRGAKLHMTAGFMLAQVERFDEATVQIEHAVQYKPKNSKLADDIEEVKRRLAFKDLLGTGTGFLISSAGYVLTNHHVINGDGRIEVSLSGQTETVPAEVIAQDEERDIALLKIALPSDKFKPLPVAAGDVGRGDPVAAFGFPLSTTLGSGLKFTQGVVSALPDPTNDGQILLDLRVNPGNSGGPLCDSLGNVVAMIARKTGSFGIEDSYAMAIPAAELIKFLDLHLPPGTPRAAPSAPAQPLTWGQVDRQVNTGVVMILNKKK